MMRMQVFGEMLPDAPPGHFELIPAPVGERCVLCEVAIKEGDIGVMVPVGPDAFGPQHKVCTFLEMARSKDAWARRWKIAARRYRAEREMLLEVCREAGMTIATMVVRLPPGFVPGRGGGEPS